MDEETNISNALYANAVGIRTSYSDFLLQFGRNIGNDKMSIFGNIFVSPEFAKVIYGLLGEEINKYEEAYGKITLPAHTAVGDVTRKEKAAK